MREIRVSQITKTLPGAATDPVNVAVPQYVLLYSSSWYANKPRLLSQDWLILAGTFVSIGRHDGPSHRNPRLRQWKISKWANGASDPRRVREANADVGQSLSFGRLNEYCRFFLREEESDSKAF